MPKASIPPRPTDGDGSDPEQVFFMQWLWDQIVRDGKLIEGPGYKVESTRDGKRLKINLPPGGGGGNQDTGFWI